MNKKIKKTLTATFVATTAVIPLATSITTTSCSQVIDSFPEYNANLLYENLEEFVNANPERFVGSAQEAQAAVWVQNKLESFGWEYKTFNGTSEIPSLPETINRDDRAFFKSEGMIIQNFEYDHSGTYHSTNILLSIPTKNATIDTKNIVLTCHYDSIQSGVYFNTESSQGLTDNATGVVALLTLAQFYAQHENTGKYNIQLLFCGAEEWGTHGSRTFSQYFFGNYDPNIRTINGNERPITLYGTTNVDSFEYCINLDTLAGGDNVYVASPWTEMKRASDGYILRNNLTYKNYDNTSLSVNRNQSANKIVSDGILNISQKTSLDKQYVISTPKSLFDMNVSALSQNISNPSQSTRLMKGQERTDSSDHFAFYIMGIKTASLGSWNEKINTPGGGGFSSGSQTIHPEVWEHELKIIPQSESGLNFDIYECSQSTDSMQGRIWHTGFDRFDGLEFLWEDIGGLEHIKNQFFGAWKSVFEFILSL